MYSKLYYISGTLRKKIKSPSLPVPAAVFIFILYPFQFFFFFGRFVENHFHGLLFPLSPDKILENGKLLVALNKVPDSLYHSLLQESNNIKKYHIFTVVTVQ